MIQKYYFILTLLLLVSCGASKKPVYKGKTNPVSSAKPLKNLKSESGNATSSIVKKVLKDAEKYLGRPYQYAGNGNLGFDCSGLVCKVFAENEIKFPRRSSDQAKEGEKIEISAVKNGDLLFFATSGNGSVSHVGIVHSIEKDGEVNFIHSSTSKGVIISSLQEAYWNKAFLFARRVL